MDHIRITQFLITTLEAKFVKRPFILYWLAGFCLRCFCCSLWAMFCSQMRHAPTLWYAGNANSPKKKGAFDPPIIKPYSASSIFCQNDVDRESVTVFSVFTKKVEDHEIPQIYTDVSGLDKTFGVLSGWKVWSRMQPVQDFLVYVSSLLNRLVAHFRIRGLCLFFGTFVILWRSTFLIPLQKSRKEIIFVNSHNLSGLLFSHCTGERIKDMVYIPADFSSFSAFCTADELRCFFVSMIFFSNISKFIVACQSFSFE